MSLPAAADVAIVGAGPTGLTLAASLVAEGAQVVVLDKLAEGANTSRAVAIHARTLEVLEDLEVTERLVERGVRVPTFTVRDRDRVLLTVPFTGLPTAYPYTLMIPQSLTEEILLHRLRALGGEVHRPHEVTGLEQDATGVTVTTASGRTVRAAHVVGTDGMHSAVRELAGIGFAGGAYPQSFALADVSLDWDLPCDEVQLFLPAAGLMVVVPLPGGRYRIVATAAEVPERLGVADLQALTDARGPRVTAARIRDVGWSSRFRLHHRMADRYRAGRVFLAGDAAHVHSPAGGQGMNIGIQDAADLARRIVQGRADGYEEARRPVAAGVVTMTDRMTRIAMLGNPAARTARNSLLGLAGRNRALVRRVATSLSGLGAGLNAGG